MVQNMAGDLSRIFVDLQEDFLRIDVTELRAKFLHVKSHLRDGYLTQILCRQKMRQACRIYHMSASAWQMMGPFVGPVSHPSNSWRSTCDD